MACEYAFDPAGFSIAKQLAQALKSPAWVHDVAVLASGVGDASGAPASENVTTFASASDSCSLSHAGSAPSTHNMIASWLAVFMSSSLRKSC